MTNRNIDWVRIRMKIIEEIERVCSKRSVDIDVMITLRRTFINLYK